MITILMSLLMGLAQQANAQPLTTPIFLKEGFSTVLEFDESPTKIVLGDSNSFAIEKLDTSVAVKPTVSYATTNMIVYFKTEAMKVFLLTAGEDVEPTLFRSFKRLTRPHTQEAGLDKKVQKKNSNTAAAISLVKIQRDKKNDFVTVDFKITSGASNISPKWETIRLKSSEVSQAPKSVWSQRKVVMRSTSVTGRVVFVRPKIPMKDLSLLVPLEGSKSPLVLKIGGA